MDQLFHTWTFSGTQFYFTPHFTPEHIHRHINISYISIFHADQHITEVKRAANKTEGNLLGNWFTLCSNRTFLLLAFLQSVCWLNLCSQSFWQVMLHSVSCSLLLGFHSPDLLFSGPTVESYRTSVWSAEDGDSRWTMWYVYFSVQY